MTGFVCHIGGCGGKGEGWRSRIPGQNVMLCLEHIAWWDQQEGNIPPNVSWSTPQEESARPVHYEAAANAHATAGKLVQGDRRETHGDFAKNFAAIASVWTGYLQARFPGCGITFSPRDVAHMMSFMKTARTMNGAYNPDDFVDDIGYSMIAAGLAAVEQKDTEA